MPTLTVAGKHIDLDHAALHQLRSRVARGDDVGGVSNADLIAALDRFDRDNKTHPLYQDLQGNRYAPWSHMLDTCGPSNCSLCGGRGFTWVGHSRHIKRTCICSFRANLVLEVSQRHPICERAHRLVAGLAPFRGMCRARSEVMYREADDGLEVERGAKTLPAPCLLISGSADWFIAHLIAAAFFDAAAAAAGNPGGILHVTEADIIQSEAPVEFDAHRPEEADEILDMAIYLTTKTLLVELTGDRPKKSGVVRAVIRNRISKGLPTWIWTQGHLPKKYHDIVRGWRLLVDGGLSNVDV